MSDDKPKPVDDLKQGLNLLLRAAKGAVERLPTAKLEDVAKDAAKEVGRAFESLGNEIEKVVGRAAGSQPPQGPPPHAPPPYTPPPYAPPPYAPPGEAKRDEARDEAKDQAPREAPRYDDGYGPEPPKGPRVG